MALADEEYCYLTTTGRTTGEPREIEIWFGMPDDDGPLYMLSGGRDRSNWVRNLMREPRVTVRIAEVTRAGRARIVAPQSGEDALARSLLGDKYTAYRDSEWRRSALPVAVDFDAD